MTDIASHHDRGAHAHEWNHLKMGIGTWQQLSMLLASQDSLSHRQQTWDQVSGSDCGCVPVPGQSEATFADQFRESEPRQGHSTCSMHAALWSRLGMHDSQINHLKTVQAVHSSLATRYSRRSDGSVTGVLPETFCERSSLGVTAVAATSMVAEAAFTAGTT